MCVSKINLGVQNKAYWLFTMDNTNKATLSEFKTLYAFCSRNCNTYSVLKPQSYTALFLVLEHNTLRHLLNTITAEVIPFNHPLIIDKHVIILFFKQKLLHSRIKWKSFCQSNKYKK